MTITDATLDAMERYGGGFVQQLAVLFRRADTVNRVRLVRAFHDYFDEYAAVARGLSTQG